MRYLLVMAVLATWACQGEPRNLEECLLRATRKSDANAMAMAKTICEDVFAQHAPTSVALTPDELAKLTGRLRVSDAGLIEAMVYNGTQRTVPELVAQITVTPKKPQETKPILDRQYRLTADLGTGGPLGSTKYSAIAGFSLAPDQKVEWRIVSAISR